MHLKSANRSFLTPLAAGTGWKPVSRGEGIARADVAEVLLVAGLDAESPDCSFGHTACGRGGLNRQGIFAAGEQVDLDPAALLCPHRRDAALLPISHPVDGGLRADGCGLNRLAVGVDDAAGDRRRRLQ